MAVDMFLKLEPYTGQPIKGEAQDPKHKDEIEVLSWSWSVNQHVTIGSAPGVNSGKIEFEKLQLRKRVDRATPALYQCVSTGTPFKQATLTIRKAGGDPLDYLTVVLKLVAISNLTWSGPDETELMSEAVTLEFGGAQIKYTPQGSDGKKLAEVVHGWDVIQHKAM
jgi:type VI secretion system secreted protein Hcp